MHSFLECYRLEHTIIENEQIILIMNPPSQIGTKK